jgi:tetratricopeptide (TPR) repeat protein
MSALTGTALEKKRQGNRALAGRDYAAAEESFRSLIREKPDSPEGYLGLAKVLERTHRHQEIIDLLEPVSVALDDPAVHRGLGDAYRVLAARGERLAIAPAISHYETLHAKRKDAVTYFYLGELLAEAGEFEKAFEALRSSLELDPRSGTVRTAARVCARKLGKPELVETLPGTK